MPSGFERTGPVLWICLMISSWSVTRFFQEDTGTVTVDWVLMTVFMAGIGAVSVGHIGELGRNLATQSSDLSVRLGEEGLWSASPVSDPGPCAKWVLSASATPTQAGAVARAGSDLCPVAWSDPSEPR